MAKKKKKSSFRGRVKSDAGRQTTGNTGSYLKLPPNMKAYSPTPGKTEKFDVIPYKVTMDKHPDLNDGFPDKDDYWYKLPFKVHKEVGADNETIVCLTSFGKKCPICDYKKEQAKAGVDQDELKAFKPKDRNLYAVIPIGHKKLDEEIHILDMSWWLFQKYLNAEFEEEEDYEVFPDLEEGYTLKVRWSEEVFNKVSYAEAGRIDFMKRDALKESILEDVPSLEKLLQELSYDALHAKFHELDMEQEVDEEEEGGTPTRKKKTAKNSKKKTKKEEVKLTWEDLADMDEPELGEVIESKDLDIDPEDYIDEDNEEEGALALREEVANELSIQVPKKKKDKKPTKKDTKKKTPKKEECPHDYEFGVDTDEYDECEECPLIDACLDKKEEEE